MSVCFGTGSGVNGEQRVLREECRGWKTRALELRTLNDLHFYIH